MKKILLIVILLSLTHICVYAQSISAPTFLEISTNKIDFIDYLKNNKFYQVYSGPRKEGGFISKFYSSSKDEYVFIYENNAHKITSINYYLQSAKDANNLLDALKKLQINAEKVGRTVEANRTYQQVIIKYLNE